MSDLSWIPGEIDVARPNAARMYDYFLGGAHNFDVDRALADQLLAVAPEIRDIARQNRSFLRRAVRCLADAGVDQFIDIGSGIPTTGNVHEVAQARNPDARVAYVDVEPVAVAHSALMLRGNDRATVLRADLREPVTVLDAPEVRDLIDLDRPVALLMVSMLHFVSDQQQPAAIVAEYRRRLPAGSHLAITHVTANEHADQVQTLYEQTATPLFTRPRDQIAAMLTGLELLEPGLVLVPEWRPDAPPDGSEDRSSSYAAVGVVGEHTGATTPSAQA